jgi:hypothetical protein
MEPRSVDELMDLLHACDSEHALRTAALLRRSRPADKELQVAGLLLGTGQTAGIFRTLLGERIYRLVRHHGPATDDDLLRLADEESLTSRLDAGVLEDWRAVLELLAARNSRLKSVD